MFRAPGKAGGSGPEYRLKGLRSWHSAKMRTAEDAWRYICLTDTSHFVTKGREVPTEAEHGAQEESKSIENFKNQKNFLEEEFGGGPQKMAREASSVSPPGLQLWLPSSGW